jgi:hypothetical protein
MNEAALTTLVEAMNDKPPVIFSIQFDAEHP